MIPTYPSPPLQALFYLETLCNPNFWNGQYWISVDPHPVTTKLMPRLVLQHHQLRVQRRRKNAGGERKTCLELRRPLGATCCLLRFHRCTGQFFKRGYIVLHLNYNVVYIIAPVPKFASTSFSLMPPSWPSFYWVIRKRLIAWQLYRYAALWSVASNDRNG